MKTINEILPIAGWSAYAVEYTKSNITIKYKFEDVSYLLCPKTRKATLSPHQTYHLRVRDLPLGEKHTTLDIEVVECWCYECNKFHSIRPDELHYSMAMTWRLMWQLCWLVKEGSVTDIAKQYRLSPSSVRRSDKAVLEVIDYNVEPPFDDLKVIVVDEKYLGRRLKFVTVVTNIKGEILYLGQGKGKDTLKAFFELLTIKQKQCIKIVCADRSNAYTRAVKESLPGVEICFDRFHINKNANDCLTEVRRSEFKKKDKSSEELKRSKYILTMNPENLNEKGQEKLDKLLKVNENINKAYLLKESLRVMYHLDDEIEAREHLESWLTMAKESNLKPYIRLAKRLTKTKQEILNYFRYKVTSGIIESLNSKISKIQLKMRGIVDLQHLYLRLRLASSPSFLAQLAPC